MLTLSKSRALIRGLNLKLTSQSIDRQSHGKRCSPSSPSLKNLDSKFGISRPPHRSLSTLAQTEHDSIVRGNAQVLEFPIGKVKITSKLSFIPEQYETRVECYRVLDEDGRPCGQLPEAEVSKELAVKMYTNMVTLQVMDTLFYEAQRQGRISFYLTTKGEEAINIASAAALTIDDLIFPQYREPGPLLWRGFTVQEFADQCFGNKHDGCKGRQMPIHYGSAKLNYITVASTVATQLPHAVGAAYSLKIDNKDACTITYFGDGGTSTGDFHAALNFAAVLEAPVIFLCRNNGWAISTPLEDQLRSDGIVVRGRGYGIRSIRVDGNDTLALYNAVSAARKMAVSEHRPVLVEALTYRGGHHSTSDDSTKYRAAAEMDKWSKARDPVMRFRKWIQSRGWWAEPDELRLRSDARMEVLKAIQAAEKEQKPPIDELFNDVYDTLPSNLREQHMLLRETITRNPVDYVFSNHKIS